MSLPVIHRPAEFHPIQTVLLVLHSNHALSFMHSHMRAHKFTLPPGVSLYIFKSHWSFMPEAGQKRAFSTASGQWHHNALPFSLRGAPPTFQRLMDITLLPRNQFTAAYLDEVITPPPSRTTRTRSGMCWANSAELG